MAIAGTPNLYQLVREVLHGAGGRCSREELEAAIRADPAAFRRLEASQGFNELLRNMKHSGFVTITGNVVQRTERRVGKRHL